MEKVLIPDYYSNQLGEFRDEAVRYISDYHSENGDLSFKPFGKDEYEADIYEELPMINIRHKHGLYSTEYVIGVKVIDNVLCVRTEDTEDLKNYEWPLEYLSTGEICTVADYIIKLSNNN